MGAAPCGEPSDSGVRRHHPLVGMRLLDRHNLNMDVEDGGRVVIQARESLVDMAMDRGI